MSTPPEYVPPAQCKLRLAIAPYIGLVLFALQFPAAYLLYILLAAGAGDIRGETQADRDSVSFIVHTYIATASTLAILGIILTIVSAVRFRRYGLFGKTAACINAAVYTVACALLASKALRL